jgi:uncharacterized protein
LPRRIESHNITGPAGILECLLEEPDGQEPGEHGTGLAPVLAAVVCHPHPLYGGSMHNKVVYRMARGLRRAGTVVLRFNFRGVGRSQGAHAHLTGEIEDARAALSWLRARYPNLPFALAGFSFGARVATRLGCELSRQSDGETGTPRFLLAAGFPTRMGDAQYLETCAAPRVFIQSSHDDFGPRSELDTIYARLPEPKQLMYIEAADHFFAGALDELEEAVALCV